jgi:hypothetical protein
LADAGKQVYLGKDREKDNEDATGRGENFQVHRRKNSSGIHVNHRAAKIVTLDEKSKRVFSARQTIPLLQYKAKALPSGRADPGCRDSA